MQENRDDNINHLRLQHKLLKLPHPTPVWFWRLSLPVSVGMPTASTRGRHSDDRIGLVCSQLVRAAELNLNYQKEVR